MRIGILTFHRAYNCGAALQAWALKTVFERMGHSADFPILNHVGEKTRWPLPWVVWSKSPFRIAKSLVYRSIYNLSSIPSEDLLRFRFKRFRERYLSEKTCRAEDLHKHYDLIVVGSDQVWNEVISKKDATVFFAENLPVSIPKVGYAVSYGDKLLPQESLSRVIAAYPRFSAVSVREELMQKQLSECGCKKPDVTLDPTLLLTKDDYLPLMNKLTPPRSPYLFMYTLLAKPFFIDTAKTLAKRLGVKAVIAPMYQRTRYGAASGLTYGISPDRLVNFVANAEYVLAASFHGTALAALFEKPFLSLRIEAEDSNYPSRPGNLLRLLGQEDRLVTPETSIEDMATRLLAPMAGTGRLSPAREVSFSWLKRNLCI